MTPVALNIMQFNIEYGGTGVDFDSVGKAIRAADADVVAIQEGCGNMARIAADLQWPYYDVRTQVVSKFPLLHPQRPEGGAIFVEVAPGRVIAVVNVHPASRKYGPAMLAKGKPVEWVLRKERAIRVGDLKPSLEMASELLRQGIPVILLGDFNAPSHRDWTNETVGLRPHLVAAVDWPTSVETEAVGLVDVYRALHPDPVKHPGVTWPADRAFVKGFNPAKRGQPADRIDLMYASRDITPTSIALVGEEGSELSDVSVEPWPTDHRAIVAAVMVAPAPAPALVSSLHRVLVEGEFLEIRYCAPDNDAARVAVRTVTAPNAAERSIEVNDPHSGELTLSTQSLATGEFELTLTSAGGDVLARSRGWLASKGSHPVISTAKPTYATGEPITIEWGLAPGNRADWIGVFDRGADPGASQRIVGAYTGATVCGSAELAGMLPPRRWPLPPGAYTAHLILDDSSTSIAYVDFDVVP